MKKSPMTVMLLMASIPLFAQQTDSAEFYFQKGIEQRAAKKYLLAANALDKAVQFNPKYKEAYLENGYVNLEMRKTDNAINNFSKVVEIDPSNIQAINELMELYYNYRQFSKAKEMAAKCNSCLKAEKIIAMCNFQEEDYGNAVKGLMSYLANNSQDAEATYTLGRSYLEMEQFKQAIPYYAKAVILNEEKNMWAYELGMIYYTIEDFKNAVVYFNKAADKGYPKKTDFVENLGYAYMYSGQTEQGEKMLTELMAKKPENKEMLRDIAEVFYQTKMYDKSLGYCQKLMEMDMKDGKALYQAGLCFQKMGQKDKGQAMCDQAIELDPSLAGKRQKQMSPGL
jgi:tetratricopeptide (TPR) repeat protein